MRYLTPLIGLVMLTGCALGGSNVQVQRRAVAGHIDKFFLVKVFDDGKGGCSIDISPNIHNGDDVRVEKNWRVAWLVSNTCAAAANQQPSLEFYFQATSEAEKTPARKRQFFRIDEQTLTTVAGKVKVRGNSKKCAEDLDAPCGRFKYTFRIGAFSLDPDTEIVDYH